MLVFSVPEEVAVERLVARGATSGRADDNEETIRTRMQVFQQESEPVIEFLREQVGGSMGTGPREGAGVMGWPKCLSVGRGRQQGEVKVSWGAAER